MSPAASADDERPLRANYADELDQLHLQVELMGVRVDENLERMREVLAHGRPDLVATALAADDEIDAMNVSLTERCYALLARESPVASDLRLVVSVLRVTAELERIGDLALRIVKMAPDHALLTGDARAHDVLLVLADEALERYRLALRAWASHDLDLAVALTEPSRVVDLAVASLTERVMQLEGPDAVAAALCTTTAARSLDRIADHTVVLGARLRYLVTGEPAHLAAEVR
jgi:phosphate transport system protein